MDDERCIGCPNLFCDMASPHCLLSPEEKLAKHRGEFEPEIIVERPITKHQRFYARHRDAIREKYRERNNEASRRYRANNRERRLQTERDYRRNRRAEDAV